ncbi:MAG: hypothetical protein ACFHX7_03350 [Pseudomonadota bacterium]
MKPVVARLLLVLLAVSPARQTSASDAMSGYIKSYLLHQESLTQSQNSLRLMWDHPAAGYNLQLHYELSPTFSSVNVTSATGNLPLPAAWRLTDIEQEAASHGHHSVSQNLDRLNIQFNLAAGDITLGRQAITFGMARVINPTDVFLPFDVRTFNTEYRAGVDALRFQHPVGQLGEVDLGIILGEGARADESAAFLQVRGNVDGMDLQLALTRYAGQSLIGGGLQTALGSFGFWLEAAATRGDQDYIRVSTGLDYAFTENTYGLLEYHFNGAGSNQPEDYLTRPGSVAYQRGGVFLLGRHYLIPSISLQLSPLWSAGIQSIINLSDRSAFISANVVLNASQNVYLDLGYYHFLGRQFTQDNPPVPGSEYGSSPDTLYASVRYYF